MDGVVVLAVVCFGCVAGALWALHDAWEESQRIDREFERDGLVIKRRRR